MNEYSIFNPIKLIFVMCQTHLSTERVRYRKELKC